MNILVDREIPDVLTNGVITRSHPEFHPVFGLDGDWKE
jgi:hypothetical protein